MKKLVAITIAGIAAVAILVYFGHSAETTLPAAINPVQSQQNPAASVEPRPQARLSTTPMQVRTAAPQTDTPVDDGHPPRAATRLTKQEQQQLAACDAAWERKTKREQAARDAESKDPAWAYQMEDKLREYTSQRFQSIPIDVTSIDCKTTFCDVMAQGFTPETAAEFNDAISALARQSRGNFQGMSVWHTEEAGKTLHFAQVKRRQERAAAPEQVSAEQLACMKLASLQSEREHAARDAEARDASWADPMEQLLRLHLTAKLAKHPVERLDIACKTTFCEIKASGPMGESHEAFQKVSQELASEPWADLETGGGGSSSDGIRWEGTQTLLRRNSQ
jgi:hypothetical protein